MPFDEVGRTRVLGPHERHLVGKRIAVEPRNPEYQTEVFGIRLAVAHFEQHLAGSLVDGEDPVHV